MRSAANFAVVLREAQWELDRVAYRLPRGEVSSVERHRLAGMLTELADQLRDDEPRGTSGRSSERRDPTRRESALPPNESRLG
ncbi:hypothetical protein GCM10009854_04220 [Saccharopolyspora halophila]|uniref:MarR family transcriptional regulator n=2 Tax=Saccharopolyspora halophila TaxID=405551 RepID=A0ABN3FKL7_9PSEU